MGQAIVAGGNPAVIADVLLEGMRVPRTDGAGCTVADAADAADAAVAEASGGVAGQ
jgi:hypothetical protein